MLKRVAMGMVLFIFPVIIFIALYIQIGIVLIAIVHSEKLSDISTHTSELKSFPQDNPFLR